MTKFDALSINDGLISIILSNAKKYFNVNRYKKCVLNVDHDELGTLGELKYSKL